MASPERMPSATTELQSPDTTVVDLQAHREQLNAVAEAAEQNPDIIANQEVDEQNRKIDVEILGRSFGVRRRIDHGVTQAISGAHERVAKFKNALSTPKNVYLENRYLSAKDKYERTQAKADNSRFRLTKRFYTNKARDKQRKMNGKKDKFDTHTNKMQGRVDYAKNRRDHHEGIHNNKLRMYIDRKAIAQSRKEIRKMKSEMRNDGKSRIERARFVGSLSPEQRKRIGEISLRVAMAEGKRDAVAGEKSKAQYRQNTAKEQIKTGNENLDGMRTSRKAAIANIIRNTGNRESLLQKIESMRTKLETGLDYDDAMSQEEIAQRQLEDPLYQPGADAMPTEINDMGRELLQTQLMAAEAELAGLNKAIESSQKTITELNISIDGQEKRIANNESKVDQLDGKISDYDEKIAEHNEAVRKLQEERDRYKSSELGLGENSDSSEEEPQPSPVVQPVTTTPPLATTGSRDANVVDLQAYREQRNSASPETQNGTEENDGRVAEQRRLVARRVGLAYDLQQNERDRITHLADAKSLEDGLKMSQESLLPKSPEQVEATSKAIEDYRKRSDILEKRAIEMRQELAAIDQSIAALEANNTAA